MAKRFETIDEIIDSFQEWERSVAVCQFASDQVERWSYRELYDRIDEVGQHLQTVGLKRSDRVILYAPNCPMWIVACLAVIRAGGVVVPVDVQVDAESLRFILNDADPSMIISTSDCATRVADLVCGVTTLYLEDFAKGDLSRSPFVRPEVDPEECACMFYTSGTTGNPKGVPLKHKHLVYQVNTLNEWHLACSRDRVVMPLPLHHIYPFSLGMLFVLSLGATIILPQGLTGPQLLRSIKEGDATILVGVPRLYVALSTAIKGRIEMLPGLQRTLLGGAMFLSKKLCHVGLPGAGRFLLSRLHKQIGPNLRILTSGGAPLDAKLAESLQGLGWQLAIGYGLTETSPLVTLKVPDDVGVDSVGKPLPGVEIRIDTNLKSTPKEIDDEPRHVDSQVGEIVVRGPGVFDGYRNQPEKTSQSLTKDGWFHTGDLGYLSNQHLHVVGRASSLIVTESGKKIDPEVLEAHYAKSKRIQEIGILQKSGKLVAVVVPNLAETVHENGDLNRLMHDAIDERCLQLPSYKRLSGYVLSKEPLSRTAMAKIRRQKLIEQYNRIREGFRESATGETVENKLDENDLELLQNERVKKLWNYFVTHYPEKRLSLDMSPQLDLGIDSLDWLNLTMEIRELIKAEIDPASLSEIKTMRDLLEIVLECTEVDHHQKPWYEKPEDILSNEQKIWLSPLTARQEWFSHLLCSCVWLIIRGFCKLEVNGVENVPRGAVIITPNHVSYLDAFALGSAFDYQRVRTIQWAGWTGIAFANSIARSLSRLGRVLPIDADHALIPSLAIAGAALLQGKSLVWFPEGRRTLTDDLLPFKPGVGLLLEHFDVPVVPVYLKGTAAALPPGAGMLRPFQTVCVTFGEPVRRETLIREGVGATPHARIASALRARIERLRDGEKVERKPIESANLRNQSQEEAQVSAKVISKRKQQNHPLGL